MLRMSNSGSHTLLMDEYGAMVEICSRRNQKSVIENLAVVPIFLTVHLAVSHTRLSLRLLVIIQQITA